MTRAEELDKLMAARHPLTKPERKRLRRVIEIEKADADYLRKRERQNFELYAGYVPEHLR